MDMFTGNKAPSKQVDGGAEYEKRMLKSGTVPTQNLPKSSVRKKSPKKAVEEGRKSRCENRRLQKELQEQRESQKAAQIQQAIDDENFRKQREQELLFAKQLLDEMERKTKEETIHKLQQAEANLLDLFSKKRHSLILGTCEDDAYCDDGFITTDHSNTSLVDQTTSILHFMEQKTTYKDNTIKRVKEQLEEKEKTFRDVITSHNAEMFAYKTRIATLEKEVSVLKQENCVQLIEAKQTRSKIICMDTLKCHNDDLINYYTGLSSYDVVKSVLQYLVPTGDASSINFAGKLSPDYLPLEDQLLAVLMKIRHNFGFQDLAFRFGKSKSGMSRLFHSWINFMYLRFSMLHLWPHRNTLIENAPKDFSDNLSNVMMIIDGTEIYIEKPKDASSHSQTYSPSKSANTLKGLVGVDQGGRIIYVSHLVADDKEIVKESNLLEMIKEKMSRGELLSNDEIMADKRYIIKDLLKETGDVALVIPSFATSIMSKSEVQATKNIARFRVHLKRAIARIKKYKLVSTVVPMSMLGSINQVWTVACVLSNLQHPLNDVHLVEINKTTTAS